MTHKFLRSFTSLLLALAFSLAGFSPALAAPPANDNFANAEGIPSLPFSASIDMTEAGIEPDEIQYSCTNIERSVWYSFIPTENMTVHLSMTGSSVSNALGSLLRAEGPGISGLTILRCAYATNPPVDVQLSAGQTYYLQVSTFSGQVGTVQINLEQIPSPQNDNFISALPIGSLPFTATVDLTAASTETGEPQPCYFMDRSVWYSFTPTENMLVGADTQGSAINNTNVNIYRSGVAGISDLQFLTCSIFSVGVGIFLAEAGQTYFLQAGNAFGEVGTIQVNMKQLFPPVNDNFADAATIDSLPFTTTVDVSGAGIEAGEPQACNNMDKTAWYRFTPTQTMTVRLDTQGTTISNDISIYKSGASGLSDLQFLMCASSLSGAFQAEVGQTYYLQVGTFPGWAGTIQVNLQQIFPPANDDFENRISIDAIPFSESRDTSQATSAFDDPTDCHNNGSVWYQFTPLADTTITAEANTFGSSYDTTLGVYTGGRGALELVPDGCNDDFSGPQSQVVFQATAGTTYYIMVGFCCGNGHIGGGNLIFSLGEHVRVPPQAGFSFYPNPPSRFDSIQFFDGSFDPENIGIQSWEWSFGDGASASGSSTTHQYAADGNYQVSHTVTTVDGRTASVTQTVQVRTHDVAITKVTAPQSARAGQTKAITVAIRNIRYPETVTVDLYKSTPGGDVWIDSLTLPVAVLSGNKTKPFTFNYIFTSQDAQIGKVTFRAVATINGANDAFPQDNTGISSPPTKVTR
jgi:hypothetical protein